MHGDANEMLTDLVATSNTQRKIQCQDKYSEHTENVDVSGGF
jgi:hypothetical protein